MKRQVFASLMSISEDTCLPCSSVGSACVFIVFSGRLSRKIRRLVLHHVPVQIHYRIEEGLGDVLPPECQESGWEK